MRYGEHNGVKFKYCDQCNQPCRMDFQQCRRCGWWFPGYQPQQSPYQPQSQPSQNSAPSPPVAQQAQSQQAAGQNGLATCGGCLVILLILCGIGSLLPDRPTDTKAFFYVMKQSRPYFSIPDDVKFYEKSNQEFENHRFSMVLDVKAKNVFGVYIPHIIFADVVYKESDKQWHTNILKIDGVEVVNNRDDIKDESLRKFDNDLLNNKQLDPKTRDEIRRQLR